MFNRLQIIYLLLVIWNQTAACKLFMLRRNTWKIELLMLNPSIVTLIVNLDSIYSVALAWQERKIEYNK